MNEEPTEIVKAGPDQHGLLGAILGDAFANDPVMNWSMANPALYGPFFAMLAKQLFLPHQQAYLDSANRGAAMWLPPGAQFDIKMSFTQILLMLRLVLTRGPGVLKQLYELESVMGKYHPKQPHYYLHAIGARQAHQGLGIGSALIKQLTPLCDEQQMPAYLESSSPKNVPLYERHGFEVFDQYQLGGANGPSLWFMWREPQDPR